MASSRLLLMSALALQLAEGAASGCPAGAKPFPSSLVGKGKINYANLFDITYEDTYKVVEYAATLSHYSAYHPVPSMRGAAIPPLVLYQCGSTKPSVGDAGITAPEARFFQIPVQKAAVGWGGPLPFFELLSVTEAIQLIDLTYVSSPCGQLLGECSPAVHMSSSSANWSAAASAGEVVFTDSSSCTGWARSEKDIPFLISLDPGSLQRAEWIRFVAAFFNEEAKADEIFWQIEADYKALKAMAQQLSTHEGTEWHGRQPRVAWVTKRGNHTLVSNAHYQRDFVQDAGGRLVPMPALAPAGCSFVSNTDGSKMLDCPPEGTAAFKSFLAEANVIIDESYTPGWDTTKYDFSDIYSVTSQEIPALARQPANIFRIDGSVSDGGVGPEQRVGNNWFEQMPSQPQQLLADLMEVLWSDNFQSPCGMKFLRRAIPGMGQTKLGGHDCAYHDMGGNPNCGGIHNHVHQAPRCSEQAKVHLGTSTARPLIGVDGKSGLDVLV